MSKCSKPYGLTGSQSGYDLVPLTEDEARKWGESHMDADDYEAEFGECPE